MRLLIVSIIGLLAACANSGDPYEPANRQIHAFNVGLDRAVIRPVTRPLKSGGDGEGPLTLVKRVGSNLSLPGKAVNHLLQGQPQRAGETVARFAINSTLGLGGLHDPAGKDFRLPEIDTDFGQTLHAWGVPEGAYLVLPVLGPSTERDFAGKVVDAFIDPLGPFLTPEQKAAKTAIRVISKAGDRAKFGDTVDGVLDGSADSYTQLRLLYLQHRRFELGQEAEVIDPYAQ